MSAPKFLFLPFLLVLLTAALCLRAQTAFRTVALYNSVGVDRAFQVQYDLENAAELEDMHLEPATPFVPEGRYADARRISSNYVNGKARTTRTYTRTYTFRATRTGTFTLPIAVAKTADGRTHVSEPLEITVVKDNPRQPPPDSDPFDPFAQDPFSQAPFTNPFPPGTDPFGPGSPFDRIGELVQRQTLPTEADLSRLAILEIVPQQRTAYLGEPVFVDYLLVARIPVSGTLTRMPSPDGFWVTDFTPPTEQRGQRIVGNQVFETLLIKRVALIAQRSGNLTIAPSEMNANGTILDASGYPTAHSWTIRSAPATIQVLPLPASGKPVGFANAVGRFRIDAVLESPAIARNEAAVLRLTVSGAGNLPQIEAPHLSLPDGLAAEAPQVQDAFTPQGNTLSGSRTFRYTLSANREGHFALPEIRLPFFNPETRRYETAQSTNLTLTVTPSEAGEDAGAAANVERENRFLVPLLAGTLLVAGALAFWAWRRKKKEVPATPVVPLPPKSVFTPTPSAFPHDVPIPPKVPEQSMFRQPNHLQEATRMIDQMLREGFGLSGWNELPERLVAAGIPSFEAQHLPLFRQKAEAALYSGMATTEGALLEEATHLLRTLHTVLIHRQLHRN